MHSDSRSMRLGHVLAGALGVCLWLLPTSVHASGYSPEPYLWMAAVPPAVELAALAFFLVARKLVSESVVAKIIVWGLTPAAIALGATAIGIGYRFFALLLVAYVPFHLVLFGIAISLPPSKATANRWAALVFVTAVIPIGLALAALPELPLRK